LKEGKLLYFIIIIIVALAITGSSRIFVELSPSYLFMHLSSHKFALEEAQGIFTTFAVSPAVPDDLDMNNNIRNI
jgi:hypothetical protein